jgi:thiamine-phosphate pyrophosphorylase
LNKISQDDILNRIIDANVNRAKEGLRVCEEIVRFILEDRGLTSQFKRARHTIDSLVGDLALKTALLEKRDVTTDVGRNIHAHEMNRKDIRDVFLANLQRAKESIRVLEEFSKLKNTRVALGFKKIRYGVYSLEQKTIKKIDSKRNYISSTHGTTRSRSK